LKKEVKPKRGQTIAIETGPQDIQGGTTGRRGGGTRNIGGTKLVNIEGYYRLSGTTSRKPARRKGNTRQTRRLKQSSHPRGRTRPAGKDARVKEPPWRGNKGKNKRAGGKRRIPRRKMEQTIKKQPGGKKKGRGLGY